MSFKLLRQPNLGHKHRRAGILHLNKKLQKFQRKQIFFFSLQNSIKNVR
jgi:hypothetical protein